MSNLVVIENQAEPKKKVKSIYLLMAILFIALFLISASSGWKFMLKDFSIVSSYDSIVIGAIFILIVLNDWRVAKNVNKKLTWFNAFPYCSLLILFAGVIAQIFASLYAIPHVLVIFLLCFLYLKDQIKEAKKIISTQKNMDMA